MKQHFAMFAGYNRWANARIYDAAAQLSPEEYERNTGAFFKSMMGTLNHLLATDRIWMKRFTGDGDAPTTLDAIIHRDFGKLRADFDRLLNGAQRVLDRMTSATAVGGHHDHVLSVDLAHPGDRADEGHTCHDQGQ